MKKPDTFGNNTSHDNPFAIDTRGARGIQRAKRLAPKIFATATLAVSVGGLSAVAFTGAHREQGNTYDALETTYTPSPMSPIALNEIIRKASDAAYEVNAAEGFTKHKNDKRPPKRSANDPQNLHAPNTLSNPGYYTPATPKTAPGDYSNQRTPDTPKTPDSAQLPGSEPSPAPLPESDLGYLPQNPAETGVDMYEGHIPTPGN